MIIAFFRRTLLFDLSILFFFNQLVSFHSRLGSLIESKIVTFGFPGGKQCQVILYCWCDHCKHLFHQTLLKHQRKIEDISGNQGPSHQMAFRRNISCDGIRDCTRGLRWWHSYGKDLHPAACSAKCFPLWSLQANISVFIVSDSKKIKPCQTFVQCILRLWVNTFNDTESSSSYSCTKRCKTMNMKYHEPTTKRVIFLSGLKFKFVSFVPFILVSLLVPPFAKSLLVFKGPKLIRFFQNKAIFSLHPNIYCTETLKCWNLHHPYRKREGCRKRNLRSSDLGGWENIARILLKMLLKCSIPSLVSWWPLSTLAKRGLKTLSEPCYNGFYHYFMFSVSDNWQ